jgi:hypothetical protein
MKKTIKLIGIIAFVAVIGFSFAACGGGGGDGGGDDGGGGKFNGQTLKGGAPSSDILKKYGISESEIQKIFNTTAGRSVDTSDADYQGYYEFTESITSMLCFVWFNKKKARYDALCNTLTTELPYAESYVDIDIGNLSNGEIPPDTVVTTSVIREETTSYQSGTVQYYLKAYKNKDGEVPKDTLVLMFMTMSMMIP